MYQKLHPNCPVKIKAHMKRQPFMLLGDKLPLLTSGPYLDNSAIYHYFLYYLFLINFCIKAFRKLDQPYKQFCTITRFYVVFICFSYFWELECNVY